MSLYFLSEYKDNNHLLVASQKLAQEILVGIQPNNNIEVFLQFSKTISNVSALHLLIDKIVSKKSHETISENLFELEVDYIDKLKHIKQPEDISIQLLSTSLQFFHKMLLKTSSLLQENQRRQPADYQDEILILNKKISDSLRFLPLSATFSKKDIYNLDKNDPFLKEFSKIIDVVEYGSENALLNSKRKAVGLISAIQATAYSQRNNHGCLSGLKKNFSFFYHSVAKNSALKKMRLANAQPGAYQYQVFNWMEGGTFGFFNKISLPSIKTSKEIFITRQFPRITKEISAQAIANKLWENQEVPLFNSKEYLSQQKHQNSWDAIRLKASDKIEMTLIHSSILRIPENDQPHINSRALIFHVHGGGWVSQSIKSHENYLRRWARATNVPVFSVDYRLAPQNPFPAAVDDVWQAYNWIIENAEKTLGIKPEKVIFVGDSAGSNLVTVLTSLLIKEKRKVPDGLLLLYPVLNSDPDYFSPSFMESIDNDYLSRSYVQVMLKDYYGDYKGGDPLVSPLLMPDEVIKSFPPTRLFLMEDDPFHDEGLRMGERMFRLKKDVRIKKFKHIVHAIMNLDNAFGVSEARRFVNDAGETLRDLLGN